MPPQPPPPPSPTRVFQVDSLRVEVHASRAAAGAAAAARVSQAIRAAIDERQVARLIFAAAPSQNEFLDSLAVDAALDWSAVEAYHMDEYLGLSATHAASFRRYLQERLFDRVGLLQARRHLIPGESTASPLRVCLDYEELLRVSPVDCVCAGIGENGHLAFNDPPVADFLDPVQIKVVRLDAACREQQVHDGCFASIEEVPTHAYTLTIPALLQPSVVSVVVPGPRKAQAVRDALHGPVSESCPASILRRHDGAVLYLDHDSARLLDGTHR